MKIGTIAALLITLPLAAAAQTFPTKTVRIISPYPTGAGPDTVARLLAEKLAKGWGQQVIVEPRPGGNGFIAVEAVKKSSDPHDIVAELSGIGLRHSNILPARHQGKPPQMSPTGAADPFNGSSVGLVRHGRELGGTGTA